MKIASYNIENIFHRDSSLVKRTLNESINMWVEEFEQLMCKSPRGGNEIARMRELSFLLGFHKSAFEPFVVMRRKAGELYLRKKNFQPENRAVPMSGWSGWVKVNSKPIYDQAVQNKARVIAEINPDILILQEVEDRQSLLDFNKHYLPEGVRFSNILMIDGNDREGRGLALMTKEGYEVTSINSYANVRRNGKFLFDKDVQEYNVTCPKGYQLSVFGLHLQDVIMHKESGDEIRKQQARKVREIVMKELQNGKNIVVAGTLNKPSYCDSLSPVLRETELKDVKRHISFNVDLDEGKDAEYFSLGAYRMGVNLKQKDYLLSSPQIFSKIKRSGLNRKGIWPERKRQWTCYDTLHGQAHQASSHPALWMEF
ncbi:Endonuclease/Exonuclease/phosphatase family protein [Salinimicrobium catena]|uniref:Endonuclease/Exonuclease/phosphatase family protein n=1 Tax=Salinimicrobium catena TaxID=390640 RepID=A0A1H5MS56_9FLAO|nr:hypothetical protein [Salinimicrobium catena]SDL28722.1 Endonuclease/Exonuclease/phosphatase family protein [Salinimicrobium catena]SEE92199.1 Endonuclease/Exonuclease/phosphatase family protein [Salinimicrobium catena]